MDTLNEADGTRETTQAEQRRERLRREMRETILAAARQLVDERGASGLTMRAVAEAIGYSAASLYEYFGSKQELLAALFFAGAEGLAGRMESAMAELAPSAPAVERISAVGRAYRDYALANPDLYLMIFSHPTEPEHLAYASDAEALRHAPAFSGLVSLVSAGVESGELRDDDPLTMAVTLWSYVHGFVMLELTGQIPGSWEQRDILYRSSQQTMYVGLMRK